MSVEAARATGRRKLHFESCQDVLDEIHKLAGGPCRQLGNWSLGQACHHLAQAMHMSIDGGQGEFPWYLRLAAPLLKNYIITHPMKPGFKMPPGMAALLMPGDEDTAAGVAEMEAAVARLEQTAERAPHPLFGKLTRDQWHKLHMRHCELHLSLIVPE